MTAAGDGPAGPSRSGVRLDPRARARELLSGLAREPLGQVSDSVYETGRLVSLAPWLTGHGERLAYLLGAQRADGGWGGPEGYALVPTLSATEALLAELQARGGPAGLPAARAALAHTELSQMVTAPVPRPDRPRLAQAADRGLCFLNRLLGGVEGTSLPDMPAIDVICHALIDSINRRLALTAVRAHLRGGAPAEPPAPAEPVTGGPTGPGPSAGRDGLPLRAPDGLSGERLALVRAAVDAGARLPTKLLHALEVAGERIRGDASVRPGPLGAVGASPAATAAWIDVERSADPGHPAHNARRFLETLSAGRGGPVPCGLPITVFERAWVLTALARAGLATDVPDGVLDDLRQALKPDGTPAGPGLPADADTTSAALYALGLLGEACPPASLRAFDTGTHYCTWPGEDGFSVTVNAHVLEAIGQYVVLCPAASADHAATIDRISALLCAHQEPDGGWTDRWHASPYYATATCALALSRFGGERSRPAVDRAVRWVLAQQRPDGSWGRWAGTPEETAYALHILVLCAETEAGAPRRDPWRKPWPSGGARPPEPAGDFAPMPPAGLISPERLISPETVNSSEAANRGAKYLCAAAFDDPVENPPLWHDKDLYTPTAIVDATILAAVHLADTRFGSITGVCPKT